MSRLAKDQQSAVSGNSRRLIACGFLLLVVGVAIRLWHDHNALAAPQMADISSLQSRVNSAPNDLEAQIALGSGLQKAGRLEEARQAFAEAEQIKPDDPRPEVWLGMIAVQRNELRQGAAHFVEALRRDPSDADTARSLGELYARLGENAKAIPIYEHETQLRPNEGAAWRLLGLAELRIERLAHGRDALERAVTLDAGDFKARKALANTDLRLGLLEEARQNYDAVLKHIPDDASALSGMAQASLQLDSSPEGMRIAVSYLDRAAKIQPLPRYFLVRGQIALLRQDYPGAILALNHAVSADPNLAEAYGYLSQAYAASGHPKQARQAVAAHEQAAAQRKHGNLGAGK